MTFSIERFRTLIDDQVFSAIESLQSSLKGTLIVRETQRASMFSVESVEHGYLHIMQINRLPGDDDFGLTYLHELIHAVLAEECPGPFLHPDLSLISDSDLLLESARTAADWYVDGRMLALAPRAATAAWMDHIDDSRAILEHSRELARTISISTETSIASIVAHAERLGMELSFDCGPKIRSIVDILLQFNPLCPDRASFIAIVNDILTLYNEPRRFDISNNRWVEIP